MAGIAHFEIHANDLERARAFYGALFGWTFAKFEGSPTEYWLIDVGVEGQGGGLMPRNAPPAALGSSPGAFVCTIGVDSVDASFAKGLELGAIEAMGKYGIPGMGWGAYLIDPDGNLFGLFEFDPAATM